MLHVRVKNPLHPLEWLPPLCARLMLGFVFVSAGWMKIHGPERVIGMLTQLNIPSPEIMAQVLAWSELICGVLLLVGLFTRLASIPLIIVMAVALGTAKVAEITSPLTLFALSEFDFILLLLYLVVFGAGTLSLDWLLAREVTRRRRVEAWEPVHRPSPPPVPPSAVPPPRPPIEPTPTYP
jgi:putative oxidoreductase